MKDGMVLGKLTTPLPPFCVCFQSVWLFSQCSLNYFLSLADKFLFYRLQSSLLRQDADCRLHPCIPKDRQQAAAEDIGCAQILHPTLDVCISR